MSGFEVNFDLLVTNSFTQKHSDFAISLSKLESAFVKESFDVFKLSIVIVLIFDFSPDAVELPVRRNPLTWRRRRSVQYIDRCSLTMLTDLLAQCLSSTPSSLSTKTSVSITTPAPLTFTETGLPVGLFDS